MTPIKCRQRRHNGKIPLIVFSNVKFPVIITVRRSLQFYYLLILLLITLLYCKPTVYAQYRHAERRRTISIPITYLITQ